MKAARTGVILALAATLTSGCGTVCNFAGGIWHPDREPRVYGGVQRDAEILAGGIPGPHLDENCGIHGAKGALAFLALIPTELGLSFVADTLTLPITAALQARRNAADQPHYDGVIPTTFTDPSVADPGSNDAGPGDRTGMCEVPAGLTPPPGFFASWPVGGSAFVAPGLPRPEEKPAVQAMGGIWNDVPQLKIDPIPSERSPSTSAKPSARLRQFAARGAFCVDLIPADAP